MHLILGVLLGPGVEVGGLGVGGTDVGLGGALVAVGGTDVSVGFGTLVGAGVSVATAGDVDEGSVVGVNTRFGVEDGVGVGVDEAGIGPERVGEDCGTMEGDPDIVRSDNPLGLVGVGVGVPSASPLGKVGRSVPAGRRPMAAIVPATAVST